MELDYDVSPADSGAYAEYRDKRSPMARWALVFAFVFFFSLGFANGLVNTNAFGLHPTVFGLILGLAMAGFIGTLCLADVVVRRFARRFKWRRAGYPLSRCHVALDEDGVEYADDRIHVRWHWRAVGRIIMDKQHLFVRAVCHACTDRGHAVITIPKAGFESPRHMEAFLARVGELKNNAGKPS